MNGVDTLDLPVHKLDDRQTVRYALLCLKLQDPKGEAGEIAGDALAALERLTATPRGAVDDARVTDEMVDRACVAAFVLPISDDRREDMRRALCAALPDREATTLRDALREVVRRAEGGNARAQWVAEPAREALDA